MEIWFHFAILCDNAATMDCPSYILYFWHLVYFIFLNESVTLVAEKMRHPCDFVFLVHSG